MEEYLRRHETFVRAALAGEHGALSWDQLRAFHETQIRYLQQERLAHLIVTLFVATFLLLVLGFATTHPSAPAAVAALILLGLLAAYLLHYFRLENGVQRWYHLANAIDQKRGVVSARYE